MEKSLIIYNEILGEELHTEVLDCGFKIYVLPKKDYLNTHVYFSTEYGSLYNEFTKNDRHYKMPLGAAHYLEHKIFEDDSDVFSKFESLGASLNAYTNYFATTYTFSTIDNVEICIKELIKLVTSLKLTRESVDKERNIIIQELRMYADNPNWKLFLNMLSGLYHNHPVKYDIGGTEESVENITLEELDTCYQSFYTPDRMFMFVIGDIDPKKIIELIKESLPEEFKNREKAPKIIIPNEPFDIKKSLVREKIGLKMPLFYLGIKDRTFYVDTKKRLKKGIISKILSDMIFGKSSSFYEKYYETGLINFSFTSDYSYGRTFGYTGISGEATDPDLIYTLIGKEIDRYKKEGLIKKDFLRIKKKMIGRYLASFNSTKYIGSSFISYYMKDIELFDYLEVLRDIRFEEVEKRFLEHFDLRYSTFSVLE